MTTITCQLSDIGVPFKPMNAVNNGPVYKRHIEDQPMSNFETYKALKIPYARNHDAAYYSTYGGEHTVDISAIFPNFDADVNDEASYDFACTDECVLCTEESGTRVFYRLGQKIEHFIKKYNIYPPKDYQKWAQICEHIIRHYNEGWCNGFHLGITYWEIWNEPDGLLNNHIDAKTWFGTTEQFCEFYATAALHLKKCFPDLKIGGPALAWDEPWADVFLSDMERRGVPIDFFSWHAYTREIDIFAQKIRSIRALLDKHGYQSAESNCNEWNYLVNWTDGHKQTIKDIKGMKGTAYVFAAMSIGQHAPVDMMMYYDARPTGWNGIFNTDTLDPIKGYYAFLWYRYLADTGHEIPCICDDKDIFTLCGKAENGKTVTVIDYYNFEDGAAEKQIAVDFGKKSRYEVYLLDSDHNGEKIGETDDTRFTVQPNTLIMLCEI